MCPVTHLLLSKKNHIIFSENLVISNLYASNENISILEQKPKVETSLQPFTLFLPYHGQVVSEWYLFLTLLHVCFKVTIGLKEKKKNISKREAFLNAFYNNVFRMISITIVLIFIDVYTTSERFITIIVLGSFFVYLMQPQW